MDSVRKQLLERRLEALEKAYFSGVTRVNYDGKSVEYRSMADLKAALAAVKTELAGSRIRQVRVTASKGL